MTYNFGMVKIFPFIFIILWSSAFVTTKPIIDNSDPFAALAFRFFVVAFGFFIFSIYAKQKIFINKKNLSIYQIYSIMLQICKIMYVLYEGGYSDNDLHLDNIMITPTKKKTFNLMNRRIPYNGYQISAIDYGNILHKKYNINYKEEKEFLINREGWMFNEMFYSNFIFINNKSTCAIFFP